MTHLTYALFLWAVTFIATPAAAASPNHCEHIIVIVQEAADSGQLTQSCGADQHHHWDLHCMYADT